MNTQQSLRDKTLQDIATALDIATLDYNASDAIVFHSLSANQIKAALNVAYTAGQIAQADYQRSAGGVR